MVGALGLADGLAEWADGLGKTFFGDSRGRRSLLGFSALVGG